MCLTTHFLLHADTRALGTFALSGIPVKDMHTQGWFGVGEVQGVFSVKPYFLETAKRCFSNGNTQRLLDKGVIKGKLSSTLFITTVGGEENRNFRGIELGENL